MSVARSLQYCLTYVTASENGAQGPAVSAGTLDVGEHLQNLADHGADAATRTRVDLPSSPHPSRHPSRISTAVGRRPYSSLIHLANWHHRYVRGRRRRCRRAPRSTLTLRRHSRMTGHRASYSPRRRAQAQDPDRHALEALYITMHPHPSWLVLQVSCP